MSSDLLARLQAAQTDKERNWLVTEALLDSLSPGLQAAAWAAAIPHWFDAAILAALLKQSLAETEPLYADLQKLPFVEPFEARGGHNIHSVTRTTMLDHLWQEQSDQYLALSSHAVAYFAQHSEMGPEWEIEHVYHALISDPGTGIDLLKEKGLTWYDSPYFAYNLVYALAEAALEHSNAGRLNQLGEGYANFLSGEIDRIYYRYSEALSKLELARQASNSDDWLKANCIQALGDVHQMLDEYSQARARYEEALPLYRTIGARLGEANCIQALGNLHVAQEEYEQGLVMLEEAANYYRNLGMRHAEAGAINSIGILEEKRKQYQKAIEAYTRALTIYVSPIWYRNRAGMYIKLKETENAAQDIEAAAQLQPDHPYLSLRRGDLAMLRLEYSTAEINYRAALERHPQLNIAHFGLGRALLCLERPEEALAAYHTGLEYTHTANELEDAIEQLETLQSERPDLSGLVELLALLREAQKNKN